MSDDELKNELEPCVAARSFIRGSLLLQEKWVLMIIHSLMEGPTGFSELMRRGNVNTTTLSQRLSLLETTGLLVKTVQSIMPPRTSYELTEAGRALKPVLTAITEWSEKYLPSASLTADCPAVQAMHEDASACEICE